MRDIYVANVMSTPVQTASPDDTIEEAAQLMTRHNIGSVVVTDDTDTLVGVITDTDIVRYTATKTATPDTPVKTYMSEDIQTTTADTQLRDAADILVKYSISHLPVEDEDGGVIGMVTTTDLTKYLSHVVTPSPQ